MNAARIEEIQKACAYPESHSVALALAQVWNECSQEQERREAERLDELRRAICVIGIVSTKDGHDLIRRDSVLDIIDSRRFNR